jgi:hypothetical protein
MKLMLKYKLTDYQACNRLEQMAQQTNDDAMDTDHAASAADDDNGTLPALSLLIPTLIRNQNPPLVNNAGVLLAGMRRI